MTSRLLAGLAGFSVVVLLLCAGVSLSRESAVATQPETAPVTHAQRDLLRRADAALNLPKRVEVVVAHAPQDRSELRSQVITQRGNVVREYRELNMMRIQLPVEVVDAFRANPLVQDFAEEYALY